MRGRLAALESERSRLDAELEASRADVDSAHRKVEDASFIDALTGLRNRRYFSVLIGPEVLRALRAHAGGKTSGKPAQSDLVFYLVDLDNFKTVNDLYGQEAGDRVLVET